MFARPLFAHITPARPCSHLALSNHSPVSQLILGTYLSYSRTPHHSLCTAQDNTEYFVQLPLRHFPFNLSSGQSSPPDYHCNAQMDAKTKEKAQHLAQAMQSLWAYFDKDHNQANIDEDLTLYRSPLQTPDITLAPNTRS